MGSITIRKHVDSETLNLPELLPFVGKMVEIRVREESADSIDDQTDWEYLAELEAEEAADSTPPPTLEEVREILSKISGSMAAEIIADREERF